MAKKAAKKKKKKSRARASGSATGSSSRQAGNRSTARARSSSPHPPGTGRNGNAPPVQYQFKPGKSGNPSGRPKGSISIKNRLFKLLQLPVRHPGHSKIAQDYTYADLLAEMAVNAAAASDFRFFQEIFNRVDGKVPDHVVMEMTKRLVAQEAGQLAQDLLEVVGGVAQDLLASSMAPVFMEACSKAFDEKFAEDVAEEAGEAG